MLFLDSSLPSCDWDLNGLCFTFTVGGQHPLTTKMLKQASNSVSSSDSVLKTTGSFCSDSVISSILLQSCSDESSCENNSNTGIDALNFVAAFSHFFSPDCYRHLVLLTYSFNINSIAEFIWGDSDLIGCKTLS